MQRQNILQHYIKNPKEKQDIPVINVVNTGRIIAWEKWYDPLGADMEEVEWPGAIGSFKDDKIKEKIEKLESQIIDDDEDEDWNEEEFDNGALLLLNNHHYNKTPKPGVSGFMTNTGAIVPITDHTRAGKIYNFWVAHSNFRLTAEICKIIDDTEGVESFDVYTPYRWRIAIGKAFNSQEVKVAVCKNLNANLK